MDNLFDASLKTKFTPLLTVLGVCSAVLLAGCSGDSAEQKKPPAPKVSVLKVKEEMVKPSREYVGITEAKEDITIQARVEGYLIEQTFQDGTEVKKGDVLFEVDPDIYQAKHISATAKVAQDQAAVDVAILNYNRGLTLIKKGAISQSRMDELKSKKLQTEAALKVSKADLKTADLNLSYTKVRAPIDGMMGKAQVSLGDLITPSSSLASLVQNDPMYVSFQISERQLIEYRESRERMRSNGEQAPNLAPELKLSTGSTYPIKGLFESLDNRIDLETGTIEVRAVFPNPENFLLPGQHVTVVVVSELALPQLLVPQKAVQEDQAGKYVLVLDKENTVKKQSIKVGQKSGVNWIIKEGLTAGTQVIVDGIQKVRVGGKAEIATAQKPNHSSNMSSQKAATDSPKEG